MPPKRLHSARRRQTRSRAAEAAALGAAGALAATDAAGVGDVVLDEHAPTSTMTTTARAGVDLSLLTMKYSSSELP